MEFLGAIGAFFSGVASDFYKTMMKDGRWLLVAEGLWTTIYIAVCAVLIGTVIGCLLALCKISKSRVLRGIATTYTVSYTHLDVYKRQPYGCASCRRGCKDSSFTDE